MIENYSVNINVLVVVSPEITLVSGDFFCLFPHNEISPARASGRPERNSFTRELPVKLRRRSPFPEPVLIKSPAGLLPATIQSPAEMLRWNYLVYEAMFTEIDVVVFAKGVNKRQGKNWDPWELNCVFGDDDLLIEFLLLFDLIFICHRYSLYFDIHPYLYCSGTANFYGCRNFCLARSYPWW